MVLWDVMSYLLNTYQHSSKQERTMMVETAGFSEH